VSDESHESSGSIVQGVYVFVVYEYDESAGRSDSNEVSQLVVV